MDLALNNLQKLICHKTKPNQTERVSRNFNITMGAYDGAKICELVGGLLLHNLNNIIDPFQDDELIIVDTWTSRKDNVIRKELDWLFEKLSFKVDIQINLQITDYLDITVNLYSGTVSPFRKNNQYPCFINVGSNHH